MDVLGDSQLLDPGIGCGREVAIDVLPCEVPLGWRVVLVGAEVHVIVRQHRRYASGVVHLRIVVPSHQSGHALDLLEATPSVCNLIFLERAARRPEGDVILCDVAREDASVIVSDLKELEIHREGSIAMEDIDSLVSEPAERAVLAAEGQPSDAVIWEEVESRTSENTELSASFLAFMTLGDDDRSRRNPHRPADPDHRRDGCGPGVRADRRAIGGLRAAAHGRWPSAR